MSNSVREEFSAGCNALHAALKAAPHSLADTPWREGGWTRKQILGHMIDSAANNHQRFVRASLDGAYTGPDYGQQAWVDAHGYAEASWETLLGWWKAYHDLLIAVVNRIPVAKLEAECRVGDDAPVTLRFLITDYIAHQQHHLRQIQAS
ncbi:DinB family protein [Paracidobacterium acidisoli]|uniref:DinB family protein n=1 Tax=Paracidobacterium acidisoli TaxID=2303751 RepID=A0A372IRE7_9BACT|nr:DinB family protein [Paracidobacterium acidisoli]MBT9331463.1 DinB family protein [Paracidobacterium acidisoli]